ncbi:MAG TPA: VWA domain-containing protein [Candidatus Dormibacteraeota bacterium]|jgi:hypothetical protein|nr:VWA domain-containing protein [Candidatus Dormibacteraeota bacterium]
MDEHILQFVRALRAAGVRVSPPEAAEALVAAGTIDLDDRPTFRAALRGTLVKRDLDLDVFEQLFELYFSPYGSRGIPRTAVDPVDELPPLPPEALEALGNELRALLDRLSEMSDLELALMVREAGREAIAGLESLLQRGMAGRAILDALGAGSGADAALDRFQAALKAAGMDEETARAWRARMRQQLDRLRTAVRGTVDSEFERLDAQRRRDRLRSDLTRAPLGAVTPRESAEMARLVERLGRKLDSLPELRRRPRRRGALDMQRTWRANLQSGGVPFRLRWKKPPQHKPQVAALCDISNSMQSTVRFMLHFLYRLQDRFSRVRTFVFVSGTEEVTAEFSEADAGTAIDRALQPRNIAWYSSTNYGRSLESFATEYPDAVTPRTILLVLGDGRGNYTPPRADVLATLRGRARRVVWFNPESRLSWGLGDSAMPAYVPHCTQVAEVRNVAQLEAAIDAMVAPPGRSHP